LGSDQQSNRGNQCSCQAHLLTVQASALAAHQTMVLGSKCYQHATDAAHQRVAKDHHNVFESLVRQVLGTDNAGNVVLQLQLCLPVTTALSFWEDLFPAKLSPHPRHAGHHPLCMPVHQLQHHSLYHQTDVASLGLRM